MLVLPPADALDLLPDNFGIDDILPVMLGIGDDFITTASGREVDLQPAQFEQGQYVALLSVSDRTGSCWTTAVESVASGMSDADCQLEADPPPVTDAQTDTLPGAGAKHFYKTSFESEPSELTIGIQVPDCADFDLYITTDGTRPHQTDYDYVSRKIDGYNEKITLSSFETIEIMVVLHDGTTPAEYRIYIDTDTRGRLKFDGANYEE